MPLNSRTTTVNRLPDLTDYHLHHSEDKTSASRSITPDRLQTDEGQQNNPDWWPTGHRRVPDYRPINRNLDRSQRPNGTSAGETAFIFIMLRGVQINANAAYLWRNTGEYFSGRIFRYGIGGEK